MNFSLYCPLCKESRQVKGQSVRRTAHVENGIFIKSCKKHKFIASRCKKFLGKPIYENYEQDEQEFLLKTIAEQGSQNSAAEYLGISRRDLTYLLSKYTTTKPMIPKKFDIEKLETLQQLARIPSNDGEQFIHVYLNLTYGESGHISFGLNWKSKMGEREFDSLEEAISIVTEIRKSVNLSL